MSNVTRHTVYVVSMAVYAQAIGPCSDVAVAKIRQNAREVIQVS